ncbi:unnamed protein product [Chondrus crispus]|uniref:Uncharacterized protein n=1 Tax=Chondrus crispus TaxID=2769 RepID=R7Q440_CHOCR|nr:unnamed protein product [Chondrus crispus]CDF32106.1 unnamed protein product [Chondrus crispus]|eukprot:XP_005711771.1 unnamed protein product [Chondrus crispus]
MILLRSTFMLRKICNKILSGRHKCECPFKNDARHLRMSNGQRGAVRPDARILELQRGVFSHALYQLLDKLQNTMAPQQALDARGGPKPRWALEFLAYQVAQ